MCYGTVYEYKQVFTNSSLELVANNLIHLYPRHCFSELVIEGRLPTITWLFSTLGICELCPNTLKAYV